MRKYDQKLPPAPVTSELFGRVKSLADAEGISTCEVIRDAVAAHVARVRMPVLIHEDDWDSLAAS